MSPHKYLDQLQAIENAAREGIIDLLSKNPKGCFIDFDLTDKEEHEAYQYWGNILTQDYKYCIHSIGLDDNNRLVALVSGKGITPEPPLSWVDLENWCSKVGTSLGYWIIYSPLYEFVAENLQYAKPGPVIYSQERWLKDAISNMIYGEGLKDQDEIIKRLVRDYPSYPTFIDSEFDADLAKSFIGSMKIS